MFERMPDILTFKECQQILKIGKNSLLNYLHSGELDGFKLGTASLRNIWCSCYILYLIILSLLFQLFVMQFAAFDIFFQIGNSYSS